MPNGFKLAFDVHVSHINQIGLDAAPSLKIHLGEFRERGVPLPNLVMLCYCGMYRYTLC